ncbi:Type II/IV secretion system protein/Septin/AIG1 family/50S ribosome-binding GTPase, putative [Entamoeba histolytica]
MSRVVVRFILNGKFLATKPLNSQDKLKTVREKLKEKMSDSQHFLTKDGDPIDKNDEECFTIGDVIDETRIINIKGTEDKKGIRIKINDKIITTIEIDTKTYLSDVRKIVQNIPDSAYFYTLDNDKIERNTEEEFIVEDIINNEEINLKEEKENTPEINDITIGICLNGNPLIKKQLNKNISLSDVRKEFENEKQIPKDFAFEDQEGFKISSGDEQTLKLTFILHDNKVNITTEGIDVSEPSTTTSFLGSPNNSTIPGNSLTNSIMSDISPNNTKTEETDASPSNTDVSEPNIPIEGSIKFDISLHNTKMEVAETSPKTTDVSEPNIPIEGSIRLENHENGKLKIYLYPNQPFDQKDEIDAIAILVVGETGSGKTTLLNSFVNAIYGIKITDDFRYIIINEDHLEQYGDMSVSQTSQVTIYNIKKTKRTPPIKIIDTPGFGDTRGPEWDKETIKQIKEAFETKVFDLNAICFVAQSSNVKLTASQKYIFGNIINLFGKDVKKNFIAMLTFCDGEEPKVINALQSKECVFSTIIPEIDEPWYLKFNNSAIYSDKTEDVFTQMFWKLGMKSFDDFITKLEILPRKSLEKSKEVLRKRECIKAQIEGIRISLNSQLAKMNEIKKIYKQLYLNQDKVKKNENFTFTVRVTKQIKIHLKSGEYATNCNKCHKTCHHPCHVPSLISYFTNILCTCIDFYGYCKVCGCPSSEHVNESRKFEYVIEKKQETIEEVYKRYNEGKKGVANAEAMLKKLEDEYDKIQTECYYKEQEIIECVNTLSEIALNGKVTSSNEYLDMLIKTENEEKKPGYEARIEGYKKLKKANEMIEDIMKNSTTKKSKEDIRAEVEATMKKLKEEEKSKMKKIDEVCVIC